MDILRHLLGWNWKVRKLRKKWDRLREKSLKKKNPQRNELLKRLDMISPNLITLEEQRLGRIDKARISKDVEICLAEVKAVLKAKPEEIMASRQLLSQAGQKR